jgi:capsular exopolysaccharide synthesis family protein
MGVPVVAMVPRINPKLSPLTRGQVAYLDGRSPVAEAYRGIRTSLHVGGGSKSKTILVTSSNPGDGKSTTASNLAISFAQAGERTLIIDCDLRQPVQHLIFESNGSGGLSGVLSGQVKLRDAVIKTRIRGLFLLPCGPVPSDPSEQLAGKRFSQVVQVLAEHFDRIVIDSPPVMTATDAHVLAASTDATLFVLRMNRSTRPFVLHSRDALERVGANVVGAVANEVPARRAYRYYGGSWQYAAHANRLLAIEGAAAAHDGDSAAPPASHGNGNGNGTGHGIGMGNGKGNGNGNGSGGDDGDAKRNGVLIEEDPAATDGAP